MLYYFCPNNWHPIICVKILLWVMWHWRPLLELMPWCLIFKPSPCNSFRYRISIYLIYGCPSNKLQLIDKNERPSYGYRVTCAIQLMTRSLYLSGVTYVSAIAFRITSTHTLCATICIAQQQRKHQRLAFLALCEGNPPVTGHRWIPLTKGHQYRTRFHVTTSWCVRIQQ